MDLRDRLGQVWTMELLGFSICSPCTSTADLLFLKILDESFPKHLKILKSVENDGSWLPWKYALKIVVLIKKSILLSKSFYSTEKRKRTLWIYNFTGWNQGATHVYCINIQLSKNQASYIKKEVYFSWRFHKITVDSYFYKKKNLKVKNIMFKVWNVQFLGHFRGVFYIAFWECFLVLTMFLIKKIVYDCVNRTKVAHTVLCTNQYSSIF